MTQHTETMKPNDDSNRLDASPPDTSSPDTSRPDKSRRDENLVTVAERSTDMAAAMLVAVLKDAGIQSVAVGGFTAGFKAEAPGVVEVKTFESDAKQARQVLSELKQVDDGFETSSDDDD